MTTTIAPSLGHAPLFTQAGAGASPGYDFIDVRRAVAAGAQEGVLGVSSFEVTQRAAGATMTVDIAANVADALGSGVGAFVLGDAVTEQSLYAVPPHSAVINETIGANASGNPRIDQVVLEVLDHTHDGSGSNLARVRVVAGTATSGATLANRTGAAALPSSALLLADVLVANGAASITNAVIRDRRKWARGVYCKLLSTTDYSTAATSFALIDAGLTPRIECSGAPLKITLNGVMVSGVANGLGLDVFVDGSAQGLVRIQSPQNGQQQFVDVSWTIQPAAGSHLIGIAFKALSGTVRIGDNASSAPTELVIEEILRQNTKNNTTTTG